MSRAPAKGGANGGDAVGDLAEYKRKRDFKKTNEPAGGGVEDAGGMFVVQKHAATRLHYDFRLEHDGVLMSWAVPQGPSLDPTVKRLAMRTENHPIEYGSFEGVIPKGEYGAGAVIIWDSGKVHWLLDPDQGMAKGELKFVLAGERLNGEFHLVKIKPREGERGNPWLLFKSKDAFAGKEDPVARSVTSIVSGRTIEDVRSKGARVWSKGGEKAPRAAKPPKWEFVEPALATRVEKPPAGEAWIHEIKYDGYRLIASVSGESVRLYTRNGLDWTGKFQTIADALAAMNLKDVRIDGEVAVAQANGRTDFASLQKSLESGVAKGVSYFAFDLLAEGAEDLRKLPLSERKAAAGETARQGQGADPFEPLFRRRRARCARSVPRERASKAWSRRRPALPIKAGEAILAQGEARERTGIRCHRLPALRQGPRLRVADAGRPRKRQSSSIAAMSAPASTTRRSPRSPKSSANSAAPSPR